MAQHKLTDPDPEVVAVVRGIVPVIHEARTAFRELGRRHAEDGNEVDGDTGRVTVLSLPS